MDKYNIDPELTILKPLRFKRYTRMRRFVANFVFRITVFLNRPKKGILRTTYKLRGYNHRVISVYVYRKKGQLAKSPGLLYIHGGGFQMVGTPVHLRMLEQIVDETGYKVVYVKYHLAPKYPFPAGFFDCYHALLWMKNQAEFLNIDEDHISVGGDSAGGNLATGIALYARDKRGPNIVKQMLLYPVIDIKQETDSMKEFFDAPMWNSILNKSMWEVYLQNGDFGMLEYASPSLASLENMPETYIETAQYDCLRDEAIDYARKLSEAGVKVVEHHTRKSVHGYDAVFYSEFVKKMIENRVKFLNGD
ncbi:MAG: alpha/beta hydrolase [Acholeplasmataceae bacterium]|nr:alpha/beta hydrolase [Acholeplasmataceae bacterium]